jgi:hypothetical protein
MLYDFPYLAAGFTEEEWDGIPRTDKTIIRDYYLFGGNQDKMLSFEFYDTDRKIRGAMKIYHLRARPFLTQLSLA